MSLWKDKEITVSIRRKERKKFLTKIGLYTTHTSSSFQIYSNPLGLLQWFTLFTTRNWKEFLKRSSDHIKPHLLVSGWDCVFIYLLTLGIAHVEAFNFYWQKCTDTVASATHLKHKRLIPMYSSDKKTS